MRPEQAMRGSIMWFLSPSYRKAARPRAAAPTTPTAAGMLLAAAAPVLPAAADEADEATEDALEVAELKSPPPELNCDDSED